MSWVGSWPFFPPQLLPMAILGTVSGRFATMMRATSGCLFRIMARESVQLAQCAALQPSSHWSTPDPQTRTAETPVNVWTAPCETSPRVGVVTGCKNCWTNSGRTDLNQKFALGLRRRETTRFGGLPPQNPDGRWEHQNFEPLGTCSALGSNTRADVVKCGAAPIPQFLLQNLWDIPGPVGHK